MLTQQDLTLLHDAKHFIRDPYAWPGAYPSVLITADGGALCADCTRDNWREICAETFENTNNGFRVAGVDVNWENNDLHCDHCNARIPAAYED